MTKIMRIQFSNAPQKHWYNPPWVDCCAATLRRPGPDMIEMQAELEVTRSDSDGFVFSPDGTPAAVYCQRRGMSVKHYFDAQWGPAYDTLSRYDGKDEDVRWLEQIWAYALHDNPTWRAPSYDVKQPTRYTANMASDGCKNYLYELMSGQHHDAPECKNIMNWVLDDMVLHRMSPAVMAGWFEFLDEFQKTGARVMLNGAWQFKPFNMRLSPDWYPADMDDTWYYPVAEHLVPGSSLQCEFFVGNLNGTSTTEGWQELTELRYRKMAFDLEEMGIPLYMTVMWQGETATYREFMEPMLQLAGETKAVFVPGLRNWTNNPYEDWMVEYQAAPTFKQRMIDAANANQVLSLDPDAMLQKACLADGFIPVSPSFDLEDTIGEIGPEKKKYRGIKTDPQHLNDDGSYPDPRVYFIPIPSTLGEQWDPNRVEFYDIPRNP